MKFSRAPDRHFWLSPYFLFNLLLILAYPYLRIFTDVGRRDLRHLDSFGFLEGWNQVGEEAAVFGARGGRQPQDRLVCLCRYAKQEQ